MVIIVKVSKLFLSTISL